MAVSKRQKQMLKMREAGKSYLYIATRMNTTEGSVRSHVSHARRARAKESGAIAVSEAAPPLKVASKREPTPPENVATTLALAGRTEADPIVLAFSSPLGGVYIHIGKKAAMTARLPKEQARLLMNHLVWVLGQ